MYLTIYPRLVIRHRPVGILQALSGWICYNPEDRQYCKDSIDQIQEPGLDILDRDRYPE